MRKDTYSSEQISEYNESLAKTVRLAECWERINRFKRRGNHKGWKNELDIVLDEIIPDAKMLLSETDYKKHIVGNLKEFNKHISENLKENNTPKLVYWLRTKERLTRYVQNLTGKGIKIKQIKDLGRAIEIS